MGKRSILTGGWVGSAVLWLGWEGRERSQEISTHFDFSQTLLHNHMGGGTVGDRVGPAPQ